MTEFTPYASFAGGLLIGLAALIMMLGAGRIAGISGIAADLLPPLRGLPLGSIAFVTGLAAAPALLGFAGYGLPVISSPAEPGLLVGAGLLAGFGSVWGSGCTSGHGVCGLARLSARSLVATVVFMAAAAITVFVTRHSGI